MNNQLTKIENGKVVKKENVTEEQLVNRLYKYERLGTVGKILRERDCAKYSDDIWRAQLGMERADIEYYKTQARDYEERYNNLKCEINTSNRFREINAGLKQECRRYKDLVKSQESEIESLKEQLKNNRKQVCDEVRERATPYGVNVSGIMKIEYRIKEGALDLIERKLNKGEL